MEERELNDLVALTPPLVRSLEVLTFISRHFHPPDFQTVMRSVGLPDEVLRAERHRLDSWPPHMAEVKTALATAADAALAAFADLRAATLRDGVHAGEPLRMVHRAFQKLPLAMAALYPLAGDLPPVNRFFLEPGRRDDGALLERLADDPAPDTGLFQADNDLDSRGGFTLYVPEYYSPDRAWPLVVALHGGSGHGGSFLWTWLAAARSHGALLVAPTSVGPTWSIGGEDLDTPNLHHIVGVVAGRWNVDPSRLLLTGMSDGGTFTYLSGLDAGSPFTHVAPVSAGFNPIVAELADPERVRGLPMHIVHGALDWMFPVDTARQAEAAFAAAGAEVTYSEIGDLSHTYPREINAQLLAWLKG